MRLGLDGDEINLQEALDHFIDEGHEALIAKADAGVDDPRHANGVAPDIRRKNPGANLFLVLSGIRTGRLALVLGAIAGYLAGFLVKGDEGLGIIGHIVLGIVGALVGGFLAGLIFGVDPIDGALDISSIVVAVIGAIITVLVVSYIMGRSRGGSGAF